MTTRISQRELRNDNAELMRRVVAGESFTVTRRGEPIADLVLHQPGSPERRRFVPAVELSSLFVDSLFVDSLFVDVPQWDTEAWAIEQIELDRAVDDSVTEPWLGPRAWICSTPRF